LGLFLWSKIELSLELELDFGCMSKVVVDVGSGEEFEL